MNNRSGRQIVFLLFVLSGLFSFAERGLAQHEGHNMPGMNMSKAKPRKPAVRTKVKPKRRVKKKRRRVVKKNDTQNMPGMQMPAAPPTATPSATPSLHSGMNMPAEPVAASSPTPHVHTPGMNMPGGPVAGPSPTPHVHMPGMNMPAEPAATSSPTPHVHMPGMNMPAPPAATSSPTPHVHMPGMNMPAPSASPSAQQTHPHDAHAAADSSQTTEVFGPDPAMSSGALMLMSGNQMFIRVGNSRTQFISMGAMGSGTSWQPASGPMNMIHKQSGDWVLMFHYNATIGVNSQGGPRGVTKFESANWFMPMAYHKLGKGTLQLRGMFSFEPFTFPPGGSPLLFQTGETYKGQPLIDRQHPHDLFMELSAQYTHPLAERATWFVYLGYPGEPALGPVAFMHRQSASENPAATLAHHLQDSTHIAFGVLTTGLTYRWLKLEGSVFNGREPDENRYDFDAHRWNSRSARLSVMPNKNWTMQVSYGFLRSPEGQEPETDIRRVTASLHYNRAIKRGNWASAFVWGRNHSSSPGETHNLNGYTFESTVNFLDKNYLYTRMELVDKNELLRPADRASLGIVDDHPSFRIGAYTFGGARDFYSSQKLTMAIGSDLTFYSKPAALDQLYGSNPVSWKLFLRFRPGKMEMGSMHGGHTMH